MDVISLYQSGVQNVSASLGTALTDNQAALLKRYTDGVILSYDADDAGRKAALRGLDILYGAGMNVKVLHVTDGKDPDEFVKKKGKEAFIELTKKALPYADSKICLLYNSRGEQYLKNSREIAPDIRKLKLWTIL